MDIETILSAIGSVGFPIVACVYLFILMNRQNESHKEEQDKLTDAINELKLVMAKILVKLGVDDDE